MKLIDFEKINNKHIKEFLSKNSIRAENHLMNVKGRDKGLLDELPFKKHSKDYYFDYPIDQVWEAYKHMPAKEMWKGKLLEFGVGRCKAGNVVYAEDKPKPATQGDVLIIDVRFLNGLIHTVTGHELLEVNNEERFIETSYINLTTTTGFQKISLKDHQNGQTKVTHQSFYNIGSFVKKNLYPIFHKQVINLFHTNVNEYLKRQYG